MKCKYFLCSCLFILIMFVTISFGACSHSKKSSWRSDGTYHWKVCNDCGATVNKSKHSMQLKKLNDSSHYRKCSVCPRQESSTSHSFSKATCTKAQTCACGATKGSKLGHNYGAWESTKAPTCTTDGSQQRKCTRCGNVDKGVRAKLGHYYSTYAQDSTMHYKKCSRCGVTQKGENHTYSNGVCTVCNRKAEVTTPRCSHSYGAWVSTKDPTCTTEGSQQRTCSKCGNVDKSARAALGHYYSTYAQDLTMHYKKCSRCGVTQKGENHTYSNGVCTVCNRKTQVTTTCSHTYGAWVSTKAPTCTTEGSQQRTCSKCGNVETGARAALGHYYNTYAQDSTMHYKKCSRCGATQKGENHTYSNGVCTVCNRKTQVTPTACSHSYGAWVFTKDPTCTTEGSQQRTCSKCGNIDKSARAALGHYYNIYATDSIMHYKKCSRCGVTQRGESHNNINNKCDICNYKFPCSHKNIISATCKEYKRCADCDAVLGGRLPHNYDNIYVQDGDKHYETCIDCGSKSQKEKHEIKEFTIVKEATCMNKGEQRGICWLCGYEVIEELKKTDHFYSREAGYSSDSKGHYTHCIYCDSVNMKYEKHRGVRPETGGARDGICDICGWVCKNHNYEFVKKDNIFECSICGYRYNQVPETCEHDLELKIDLYGHYTVCKKCNYKDMYNNDGSVNKKKYGAHSYGKSIDLCNGKHMKSCEYCKYELKSVHVYLKDVCIGCGSENIPGGQNVHGKTWEFDLNSETQRKELQRHLLHELGYYIGGSNIDGIIGSNTIKAINLLLENQGSTRTIKNKEDITDEIFSLIMNCTETKTESEKRILLKKIDSGNYKQADINKACSIILEQLGYYNGSNLKEAIRLFCMVNKEVQLPSNLANPPKEFFDMLMKFNEPIIKNNEKKFLKDMSTLTVEEIAAKDRKERVLVVQMKLKQLGYYNGIIDGDYNNKDFREAYERYLMMNDTATKIEKNQMYNEGIVRLLNDEKTIEEVVDEVIGYIIDADTVFTPEQDEKFMQMMRDLILGNIAYSQENRETAIDAYRNNGDLNGTMIDCSALCSLIYEEVLGIDCWIESSKPQNDRPFVTSDFGAASDNFEIETVESIPNYDELPRGTMILGINKSKGSHIMIVCGNGVILHSSGTGGGVSFDTLDINDSYTHIFLDKSFYTGLYVLTPKK